jgi:hypothetical protein
MTKTCHDIDFILWLLCSPASTSSQDPPHLPSLITSVGNLTQFRKARKPLAAGSATNCISCPITDSCLYSSKKIYVDLHLNEEGIDWPLRTVVPEIEDLYQNGAGRAKAEKRILEVLAEDYTEETPVEEVKRRPWFGRCVWECDNDVCDDQVVTMAWEDDPLPNKNHANGLVPKPATSGARLMEEAGGLNDRGAKTAVFHMIAPTQSICERRGRVYGTLGEISYRFDGDVSVYDFATGTTKTYSAPEQRGGGHGGGDDWLAENFCRAVAEAKGGMDAVEAQKKWLGCDVDEVLRSHVAVFAGEKARKERVVVDFKSFWEERTARLGK